MKIKEWLSVWRWTRIVFGEGYLDRLIVFECKYLFSIYVNFWNTIAHDRFHTHAFPSVSIMLRGWYFEQQKDASGAWIPKQISAPWIRFIPRTNEHRMLRSSPNAISVTIAGPWDRYWTETFLNGVKRVLTWGRGEVARTGVQR